MNCALKRLFVIACFCCYCNICIARPLLQASEEDHFWVASNGELSLFDDHQPLKPVLTVHIPADAWLLMAPPGAGVDKVIYSTFDKIAGKTHFWSCDSKTAVSQDIGSIEGKVVEDAEVHARSDRTVCWIQSGKPLRRGITSENAYILSLTGEKLVCKALEYVDRAIEVRRAGSLAAYDLNGQLFVFQSGFVKDAEMKRALHLIAPAAFSIAQCIWRDDVLIDVVYGGPRIRLLSETDSSHLSTDQSQANLSPGILDANSGRVMPLTEIQISSDDYLIAADLTSRSAITQAFAVGDGKILHSLCRIGSAGVAKAPITAEDEVFGLRLKSGWACVTDTELFVCKDKATAWTDAHLRH